MKSKRMFFIAAFFLISLGLLAVRSLAGGKQDKASKTILSENDQMISAHAQQMVEEGRRIFRYDTFGSEAFWGDALQLHKAIAGEKNGGVGGGVSPKTALAVGLKVDVALSPRVCRINSRLTRWISMIRRRRLLCSS
jgi:hypothetical protein